MEDLNPSVPHSDSSLQLNSMKQMLMHGDHLRFFPQEIISNILKRLPVKSLIRFQCVCKNWKHLIKTPYFIAEHLQHSTLHNPSLLLHGKGEIGMVKLHLLDCEMQVRDVENAPLIDSSSTAQIIGSSNGLLCVKIITNYGPSPPFILLWNPAIREVRQVSRTIDDFVDLFNLAFGFGFSPIVNDYKLVRILAEHRSPVRRVEVYSLNTGTWKEIDCSNLEGVAVLSKTVTVNGTIFWPASDLAGEVGGHFSLDWIIRDFTMIVSFDIATEEFTLIRRPIINSLSTPRLTVYESKLAILCGPLIGDFNSLRINVWVMEEGASSRQKWSWSLKYTISFSSDVLYPCSIWRNEIVCKNIREETRNNGRITSLSLINLSTYESKRLTIRDFVGAFSHIFNHVESLVPVGNIHVEEPLS